VARKMKKVKASQVIMKKPRTEFSSSGSYAVKIPEDGQNMIPKENQKAP
jgi:hypothetical protein